MTFPPPGTEVRAAEAADAEPLLGVLCAAFRLDCDAARPLFYQDPYYDLALKRVLTTPQDGIVACLTLIPATLVVRGAALQISGIAGVATHPAHQNQGYATRLLTETLRALLHAGEVSASALFPYSDKFYRRLGWETAARARRWVGTIGPFPADGLPRHFHRARLEEASDRLTLQRLRAALPPAQTGLCRRDAQRWRVLEMTAAAWQWHVYEDAEGCRGYVAWQRPDDGSGPVVIHEMVADGDKVRRALLFFLSNLTGSPAEYSWVASPGQHAAFGLSPACQSDAIVPGMMLRLGDVAAVLRALHPALAPVLARAARSLTLALSDPLLAPNNAAWRLTPHGVDAGTATAPDWLRLSVGTLAPILTGDCLPSTLAELGEITASSPAALALADELFPLVLPFVAPADQF